MVTALLLLVPALALPQWVPVANRVEQSTKVRFSDLAAAILNHDPHVVARVVGEVRSWNDYKRLPKGKDEFRRAVDLYLMQAQHEVFDPALAMLNRTCKPQDQGECLSRRMELYDAFEVAQGFWVLAGNWTGNDPRPTAQDRSNLAAKTLKIMDRRGWR